MKKLFLKIAAGMILVVAVSFFLSGLIMHHSFQEDVEQTGRQMIEDSVNLAKIRLEQVPRDSLYQELENLKHNIEIPLFLHSESDVLLPYEIRQRMADGNMIMPIPYGMPPSLFVPIHNGDYILEMGPLPRMPGPNSLSLSLLFGAVLFSVIIVGLILVYPVARKLRLLESTATALGSGDLTARADIDSSDPVGRLADCFNMAATNIERMVKSQRQLLQAVSHELRTPLSRIKFSIEILSNETAEREKQLRSIDQDLDELDVLVDELLVFNRYNAESPKLDKSRFDVIKTIAELKDKATQSYPGISISLESDKADNPVLFADKRCFVRVVRNVLQNACRYARSEVSIEVGNAGNSINIEIADDGPGIPAENRDIIFEPFTRLDESRNRRSGGAGLGLAISKTMVKLHGGGIEAGESSAGGAKFMIEWPSAGK
jgi:two-component system sensor histidine kinase RstB